MQDLVIINAGKLGREVHNWAAQCIAAGADFRIKGFLDDRTDILNQKPGFAKVLGAVDDYEIQSNDRFLVAIGDPIWKRKLQTMIENRGGSFATLIHPTAVIGVDVTIGPGSIVCPFCHISCNVQIGRGVFLGTHGNFGHDTTYGDFCQICGSCEVNGNAIIEQGVFLGSHATILPEAQIEKWSYVGAHTVVLRKVRAFEKVFGVPAVVIGKTMDRDPI